MKKKGLCSTCENDKYCNFPRSFPVMQCEEFNGYTASSNKTENSKKTKKTISKQEKAAAHI